MGDMKIGISTASYFPKLFTEQSIEHIAALGADLCEVFFASRCEYKREFAETVRLELNRCGVEAHSVHALTTQFEPEFFSRNDRAYADAVEVGEEVLTAAEIIGARRYTFHGAMCLKKTKYTADYPFFAERLNALCAQAARHGVEVCYETVHWAYFNTPEYFARLKELVHGLRATLDIKQTMQTGLGYEPFLDAIGDRLRTVHLCDFDDDGRLRLPGEGSFDFVTLFARLLDGGYSGPALMEVYTGNYDTEDRLKRAFEYLKECAVKAEVLCRR